MCLFLILILSFFNFNPPYAYQPPMHIKFADSIQEVVGERLEKRHQMENIGQCGALFDKINSLGFRFQATGPKTKEELREILIDCAEDLVNAVNRTEGISQYLPSYPFTIEQADIAIFLRDKQNGDFIYPLYSTAGINQGRLRFYTVDKYGMGYKTRESESYEEALKALGR